MRSFFLTSFLALTVAMAFAADSDEDAKFTRLLDRIWARSMEESPEWATSLGKREGLDRWTDQSFEAIERRDRETRAFLAEIEQIDGAKLSPANRVDHAMLRRDYREWVEGERFPGELLALDQLGGVHTRLTGVMRDVPAERAEDFEAALRRLRAYPRLVDQNIALLERGLETGVTPPRVTLGAVPRQIDALLAVDTIEHPALEPFRNDAPLLSPEQRERYRAEAVQALRENVLPALRKFRAFVVETYLPRARETLGMSALPDGEAWYAYSARSYTTTDQTPRELHDLGLAEMKRIRAEMETVKNRAGFKGTVREYEEHLRKDPRFYFTEPDALVAGYRDICKRADAELPRLFGKLPRLTYGVRPIPAHSADAAPTAYYQGGSLEAGRPGWFEANTTRLESRAKWEMTALALHEAAPGHHLQIALAQEQEQKHELLRERGYTAFIEGWGLYAEWLGLEMGLYKDPADDFGRLTFEAWRAARLVVDTGMHALGWTRQKAIDYLRENTALGEHNIRVEVDRYLVMPGQALAYKVGQLRILELRRRAEQALGERFDVRAFHDVVLGAGAVPLDVLQQRVDEWIAEREARRRNTDVTAGGSRRR